MQEQRLEKEIGAKCKGVELYMYWILLTETSKFLSLLNLITIFNLFCVFER